MCSQGVIMQCEFCFAYEGNGKTWWPLVLILHVGGVCGWSAAMEKNKGQGNFGNGNVNFGRGKNKNFSWVVIFIENMLVCKN